MSSQRAELTLITKANPGSGLELYDGYRFDRAIVYAERMARRAEMEALRYVLARIKKWRDAETDKKKRRAITARMGNLVARYQRLKEIEDNYDSEPEFLLDLKGKVYGPQRVD